MADFKINGDFLGKDILSLDQFSPKDISILFKRVNKMKPILTNAKASQILKGNLVTLIFYEPSTRTFSSFSAAVKRLGGETIEFQNPMQTSSAVKGETLEDTIKMFEAYSDAIIIRHPKVGTTQKAADVSQKPIINAGDGIGEHPTQALLDLFTIYEHTKRLDNLVGVMAGDMLNGRTVHSLIRGLSKYKNNKLYLLSPKELALPREDFKLFQKLGVSLFEIYSEKDIPENADFWYWTRVQKERFKSEKSYEKVKNRFILSNKLIKERAGKLTIFMHPLPRVGEISTEVDSDPRAMYLTKQIRNSIFVRMALLTLVLGKR